MPKELTETQAEIVSDLQSYFSMGLGEVLGRSLSKKQAERLMAELHTVMRRGAESFARDLNKLSKDRRQAMIDKVATQNS